MKYKIFYDTETTGLDLLEDRVIELGVLVTDADLNVVEKKRWRFNPEGKKINIEAISVHGIKDNDLLNEPLFKDSYREVLDIFFRYNPYSLTMHNGDYDTSMLSREFSLLMERHNIDINDYIKQTYPDFIPEKNRKYSFDEASNIYTYTGKTIVESDVSTHSVIDYFPTEDTMMLSAYMTSLGLNSSKSLRLDNLANILGVDLSRRQQRHDALVDTEITYECYKKLKENYLKDLDFIDMVRHSFGMNVKPITETIKDEDRLDKNIAEKMIDLSKINKIENKLGM